MGLIGFFSSLIVYLEVLGHIIVKSFIFWIAFNFFAPFFSENVLQLPVVHIGYWVTVCFFILVHFIGGVIKDLVPPIVKIENKTQTKT